ncbi:2-dehydropantoate 2-reductase [Taklimakanibacter deserti]|uniref:2-dehydropantoate 2-reductase n=1 Tax=Taklimakanibacter deserti TaxID=2267839 RepID=UPI000E657C45
MRICVFGAGAIGGLVGARLARQGDAEVSLIARGPHLAAMRENGLTLKDESGETRVKVQATDKPQELGPQDYVFLALKAHSLPGILDSLKPLLGPDTAVVTAQNGVPWWYFYKHGGVHEGLRVEAVDPQGRLWDGIGPERVIGCVVHPAAEIEAPGIIRHIEGDRLPLGEPSGEKTERTASLAKALIAAGFKAPIRPQIRNEIWVKLWGNLSLNPVSALTGGTLEQICRDPGTRAIIRAMMVEAEAIGKKLGASFGVDVDRRIAGAEAVGAHKTSMLQDLELGRPMEVDALVTAVQELGRLTQTPTPTIDIVQSLIKQRAELAGCL